MDNNNITSEIVEENSEQNQKELNSSLSKESESKINNEKIEFSINENNEFNQENSSSSYLKDKIDISVYISIPKRIKPNLIRLSRKILNDLSLCQWILNYLNIFELNHMRRINHNILSIIHQYYKKRIKMEIDFVTDYQEKNKDKVYSFMKNIDTQIPISNKNWLDLDLNSVVHKLHLLNRNIITKLRSIKNINKIPDVVYAPFCIIFSKNKKNYEKLKITWKQIANQILSDFNIISLIQNLDIENLDDKEMLEAFMYLNLPELEINNLKKCSSDITKLVMWSQAVVSYHIIIHPYIYRNKNDGNVPKCSMNNFIYEIETMIEKFYKFKRFLYKLNIMKIPLADYVFNLQLSKNVENNILKNYNLSNNNNKVNYIEKMNTRIISNILSYIPFNQSHKMMIICKKFYEGFKSSIDIFIFEMIKEIYSFRYQIYQKLKNKIPVIFSYNFFSKFFLMIDDIINSNSKNGSEFAMSFYPFLSKEQLNDIKILKIKSKNVETISKIFCIICDIKPYKIINKKTGKIDFNYINVVKSLAVKGELLRLMRDFNKLFSDRKKIEKIYNEIKLYINNQKLIEVKKVNRGIYQLLIWELYILLYLKIFNIFDFSNVYFIQNIYNNQELESIHYYIELMNYLKYYLKIKYHFSGGNKLSMNSNRNFDFCQFFKKLTSFLGENNLSSNNDIILQSTNIEWEKIGKVYFESKDLIPLNAKTTFYERIMIEILNLNDKKDCSFTNSNYRKIINNDYNLEKTNSEIKNICKSKSSFIIKKNKEDINIKNKNYINNNFSPKNYFKSIEKQMLNLEALNNNKKFSFDLIPKDIFIKYIFFYIDINSLSLISLINHKYLSLTRTHLYIRFYFLKKEKKYIESESKEIFSLIKAKRKSFFKQYEVKEPNKEHALKLINHMTEKDILELKQCFKKYNKTYEQLITPFLMLLEEKPISNINSNGIKELSFYRTAQKVLFKNNFIKRIREIELELIPHKLFKKVESLMKDKLFEEKNIKNICPCFDKLTNWILGVLEFHRSIRKYSLSDYDYDILNNDEINFCNKMDDIILLYFKLNRYINKYCQIYEDKAQKIMKEMGIINK